MLKMNDHVKVADKVVFRLHNGAPEKK